MQHAQTKRDRRTKKYNFIAVDHCGKVLPQCAGCMKTLFKATMKLRRLIKCHEDTNHVDKMNCDLSYS